MHPASATVSKSVPCILHQRRQQARPLSHVVLTLYFTHVPVSEVTSALGTHCVAVSFHHAHKLSPQYYLLAVMS